VKRQLCACGDSFGDGSKCPGCLAELDAAHRAECERMVRKAAVQTLIKAMQNTPWGEEPKTMNDWIDRIVREVMEGGK